MMRPVQRCPYLAVLALLPAWGEGAPAKPAVPSPASIDAVIAERLSGCANPDDCNDRLVKFAMLEKTKGPIHEACRARIVDDITRARSSLLAVYPRVPPALKAEIFDIFDQGWDNLPHGVDYQFTAFTIDGLESPSREVRQAAARLMAHKPISQVGHFAIDATMDDPSLMLATLMAIENTRFRVASRWVIAQLVNPAPEIRVQAARTIASFGRGSVPFLRERVDDPDAATRAAVMGAWLLVATLDDEPAFETWLKDHGAHDTATAAKLTAALAAIQAGKYKPDIPPRPPLKF